MRFGKRGLTKDAVLAFITTEPLFDMVPEAELIASRYLFGRLRHLTGTRALYTVLKHREEEFQAEMVSDCVAVGENEKAESTTTPTTTAVDELTPSEQVIFRRAQNVYAGQDVPSAPELRQYFRCKRAVADKVYAALMVVAVVED
jgi:hypothetical protein